MALKFKNFRRLGSDFKSTPVPEEFIRKQNNLYVIEFVQFLLALFFIGNQLYAQFNELNTDFYHWGLGLAFLFSMISCTVESKYYRTVVAAAFLSCQLIGIQQSWHSYILYAVTAGVIVVFYFLYLHSANEKYFLWLKSISQ